MVCHTAILSLLSFMIVEISLPNSNQYLQTMNQFNFHHSLKNIPLPNKQQHQRILVKKCYIKPSVKNLPIIFCKKSPNHFLKNLCKISLCMSSEECTTRNKLLWQINWIRLFCEFINQYYSLRSAYWELWSREWFVTQQYLVSYHLW